MGMATGCGCKEVYRFPHTTYPYSSCIYLFFFYSSIPTFCSFKNFLSFLFQFYVLNNFFTQYKHTYRQLRASHGIHMKAAHIVLYMNKHTQTYASYPAMDMISCMSLNVCLVPHTIANQGSSLVHTPTSTSHLNIFLTQLVWWR